MNMSLLSDFSVTADPLSTTVAQSLSGQRAFRRMEISPDGCKARLTRATRRELLSQSAPDGFNKAIKYSIKIQSL